uniref:TTF-type domain-containing protein n=1 Tax=Kalanchoe fedtschenkoi TaxID=63787 RepID=A0A7N0VJZ7_KALFE
MADSSRTIPAPYSAVDNIIFHLFFTIFKHKAEEIYRDYKSFIRLKNLQDPRLRKKISEYNPNIRDEVRRAYILKEPCQTIKHKFTQRDIGGVKRKSNEDWFAKYKDWLEYSIEKDTVVCLCCYLFRPNIEKQRSGESFVGKGFTSWNKQDRLDMHVGGSNKAICDYRTRLLASIDCVRFLLCQGLSFRGHDESESSSNMENFLKQLKFRADHKGYFKCCSQEVVSTIIKDIDGDYFIVLIDESHNISIKEQMAVAVRYVHKRGEIIERTTALSLKGALDSLFTKYNLTISRVRGQGYDEASNMRGAFNGVKTLIMKENNSTFYVHCFAHQLQLTLVAIVKNYDEVASLFYLIGILTGVVGASCKRHDMLRDEQVKIIRKAMEDSELITGKGLNQEINLEKAAYTRCGASSEHRVQAKDLLELKTSVFIVRVILMKNVLGVINELSQALQKKDQDIVNAMDLCGRSRRKAQHITNLHHYRVQWYYSVIDMQILELNNRFDETNTELLLCMSCLSPSDRFTHFDKDKFFEAELKALDKQLDNHIIDMRHEDVNS